MRDPVINNDEHWPARLIMALAALAFVAACHSWG